MAPSESGTRSNRELTQNEKKLIDEGLANEREVASDGPTGNIPHFLAQAMLPLKDPGSGVNYWERGTDKLKLTIISNPNYGMPFGMMPRLLVAWICTEAKLKNCRELELGKCQNELLKKLKLPQTGYYINLIKEQTIRLTRSLITVEDRRAGFGFQNILIVREGFICWQSEADGHPSRWNSKLTLSNDFFDSCMRSSVPLSMGALNSLRRSPFAMDVYIWLTYRLFTLDVATNHGRRSEVQIPWASLKRQMGCGYESTNNFRTWFIKALGRALTQYRQAEKHVRWTPDHLILSKAPLHVAPRTHFCAVENPVNSVSYPRKNSSRSLGAQIQGAGKIGA